TFVAFGPDGKTLVTAGQDNTIRLWDLASGKEIRRFARPQANAPRPPRKGEKGADNEVKIEDVMVMMAAGGNSGSFRVALAPDGKPLAAAGGNVIRLWEVETGKELRRIESLPNGAAGLLFSPDSKTLAARGPGGVLYLWEADTGKPIHQIKPPPRPRQ